VNLLDFSNYFPSNESCIEHFKTQRENIGVVCKKYGYRTALRSRTALEKSHLPYLYWYKAILMLSVTRKTFSAWV